MSYEITEKCIDCGCCAKYCPKHGIEFVKGKFVVDQDRCDSCGTCKEYCPIDEAIAEQQSVLMSTAEVA